jgi:hypothetical protein
MMRGGVRQTVAQAHPELSWPAAVTLAAAVVAGGVVAAAPAAALGLIPLTVVALVWMHPPLAAYLIIGATPLLAGIDRGQFVQLLRPNELLALLVGSALAGRALFRLRTGRLGWPRVDRVERAILLLAVTSSIVPLLWMLVRGRALTGDDLLYSLVLWKFAGIYLIVRASVTTEQQVRRCLWISMAAAAVVALIAILQSLGLFGVPRLLEAFYTPPGREGRVATGRGSSTLALAAAVADLMVFNLAIVVGLWLRDRRRRLPMVCAATLFVFGALASGQISGAIGLVVGVVTMALVTGGMQLLGLLATLAVAASVLLQSVIQRRLAGFGSASGLPQSWVGRLHNLRNYFWPELFSNWNVVLGVRPAARIPTTRTGNLFVWIESGYTWLLWGGGIPLLLSFCVFVWSAVRSNLETARRRPDAIGVAALAALVAVVVVTVLMTFDPHLTYRGSADALFGLLALATVGARQALPTRRADGHHPLFTPDQTDQGAPP